MRPIPALVAWGPALLALTSTARGHGDHARASAARTVAVTLADDRARVAYTLVWRGELADRERWAADGDHDGRVSSGEGVARLDALTAELRGSLRRGVGRDLASAVDARAAFAPREVESATATGWTERGDLVLAWLLRVDLEGAGALRIDDARGDVTHSEWVVERGAYALTRAAPPGTTGVASLIASEGGGPQSIELEWTAPRASPRALAALAALGLAGAGWLGWRTQRRAGRASS